MQLHSPYLLRCPHLGRSKPTHSSQVATPRLLTTRAKKEENSLSDDLLDFAMAGQKMRKWYGAPERSKSKKTKKDTGNDNQPQAYDEEEDEEANDAVLVTDADTPIGEQVLLRLILSRIKTKAIVSDTSKARASYGDFVEPISIDLGSQNAAKKALRGCGAVISLGRLGGLSQAIASRPDFIHLIVLSTSNALTSSGKMPWSSFFKSTVSGTGDLSDASREVQAAQSCSGCTIIKVDASSLQESPGGSSSLGFVSNTEGKRWERELGNSISCEDLAAVLVASLEHPPSVQRSFQVINTGDGSLPKSWKEMFQQH
jgi:hypothetical protein